jgi:hypothetical protein
MGLCSNVRGHVQTNLFIVANGEVAYVENCSAELNTRPNSHRFFINDKVRGGLHYGVVLVNVIRLF